MFHLAVIKSPVNFRTTQLAHNKPKYGLFSRIITVLFRIVRICALVQFLALNSLRKRLAV